MIHSFSLVLHQIAAEVVALRESMELLEHDDSLASDSSSLEFTSQSHSGEALPSHAQRLALVQSAESRLEALAMPALLAAFDTDIHSQDLPRVRSLIAVFASLRRLDSVYSMFLASRAGTWLSRTVVQCGAQHHDQPLATHSVVFNSENASLNSDWRQGRRRRGNTRFCFGARVRHCDS